MTEEEALRYSVRKVIEQGKQSYNHQIDICAYRDGSGNCCAVGFLIKDEFYSDVLEDLPVKQDCVKDALIKSGLHLTPELVDNLMSLQYCHDKASEIDFVNCFKSLIKFKVKENLLPSYLLEEIA